MIIFKLAKVSIMVASLLATTFTEPVLTYATVTDSSKAVAYAPVNNGDGTITFMDSLWSIIRAPGEGTMQQDTYLIAHLSGGLSWSEAFTRASSYYFARDDNDLYGYEESLPYMQLNSWYSGTSGSFGAIAGTKYEDYIAPTSVPNLKLSDKKGKYGIWESNTDGGIDPISQNVQLFYKSMASNAIPTTPTVAIGKKQAFLLSGSDLAEVGSSAVSARAKEYGARLTAEGIKEVMLRTPGAHPNEVSTFRTISGTSTFEYTSHVDSLRTLCYGLIVTGVIEPGLDTQPIAPPSTPDTQPITPPNRDESDPDLQPIAPPSKGDFQPIAPPSTGDVQPIGPPSTGDTQPIGPPADDDTLPIGPSNDAEDNETSGRLSGKDGADAVESSDESSVRLLTNKRLIDSEISSSTTNDTITNKETLTTDLTLTPVNDSDINVTAESDDVLTNDEKNDRWAPSATPWYYRFFPWLLILSLLLNVLLIFKVIQQKRKLDAK
ncbi:hypothetical protein ACAW68_06165 [Weissella confusa]|uniref:hypothetical protein n=1 Tax=Weissella confusa TaxID=1583 RepID=UPI0035A3BC9A